MWDPINSHLGGPQAGIPYCSQRHFLRKGKRGQGWRQTWSHTRFGTTCKAFLAPLRHTPIHCILMSVPSSFFYHIRGFSRRCPFNFTSVKQHKSSTRCIVFVQCSNTQKLCVRARVRACVRVRAHACMCVRSAFSLVGL